MSEESFYLICKVLFKFLYNEKILSIVLLNWFWYNIFYKFNDFNYGIMNFCKYVL